MPTDPTCFPTTTIDASPAAIPREGPAAEDTRRLVLALYEEIAGLETELAEAEAKNAALLQQNEFLHGSLAEQEQEIAELKTEAEASEETFRWATATEAEVQKGILGLQSTITSLRAQLARAAAIEEAARGVGAAWSSIMDAWEIGPAINHLMRVVNAGPTWRPPHA